jgi:hypothetical protein
MLEFDDEATSLDARIAAATVPTLGAAIGHSSSVVLGRGADEDGGSPPMMAAPMGLGLSESFSISAGMLGSSLNMASAVLGQSFSSVLARGCPVDA